jgi:signal transduction histidine kinase/HAMP domain-containing protein
MRLVANVPGVREVARAGNERYAGVSENNISEVLAPKVEAWVNGTFPYHDVLSNHAARFLTETKEMAGDTIMGILVTDQYGAVVAATSQPRRLLHAQETWWKGAQDPKEGFLYVSDIVEAGNGTFASQGATLDVAVPIMDITHTHVIGVLKICYRFDNLFSLIMKVRIGQTGHAMLFTSDGTPLMCPLLPRKAHLMDRGLLQMIVSKKPGWTVAKDDGHGAQHTVVGFAPLDGLKTFRTNSFGGNTWHVFVRQLPSESFGPLWDLLYKVGAAGFVLLVVLASLGRYVGGRLVRPIQLLREGVEAIRDGDLSQRLSIKTGDEVESLSDAVNSMASELEASKGELENCNRSLGDRVAEKTNELSRQLRFMDAVLGNMAEGLVILNRATKVVFMNAAAKEFYGEEHGTQCAKMFYGRLESCTNCKHPCMHAKCPLEELITGRRQIYQYETTDRVGRLLEITMVPTASEAGEGLVVVLMRDITQEAKLKRQVQLSDKLSTMGKMAAGIAHEINNPLGIVINRIECIERETQNRNLPEGLANDLNTIKTHASRIARITKSLLTGSRDSAMTLKALDVNAIIKGAIDLVKAGLRKSEVILTSDLLEDLPPVIGDKDKLETVILNLLNNAIDAAPLSGGAISITTRLVSFNGKQGVQIAVADNGSGILPKDLDKVFEPFFTTKPAKKGTGLGLFLSYGIVKEHKGEITVAPNNGAGSVFHVTLPGHEISVRSVRKELEQWTVRS